MSGDISLRVKEIRNKHNLSQERFGKKIGLSGKTISSYETGRCIPPLKVLDKISDVYGVPVVLLNHDKKEELKIRLNSLKEFLEELSLN
jgi:transcriptional regulator with XRE-family HTH domain